jgi:hypothetical protein
VHRTDALSGKAVNNWAAARSSKADTRAAALPGEAAGGRCKTMSFAHNLRNTPVPFRVYPSMTTRSGEGHARSTARRITRGTGRGSRNRQPTDRGSQIRRSTNRLAGGALQDYIRRTSSKLKLSFTIRWEQTTIERTVGAPRTLAATAHEFHRSAMHTQNIPVGDIDFMLARMLRSQSRAPGFRLLIERNLKYSCSCSEGFSHKLRG